MCGINGIVKKNLSDLDQLQKQIASMNQSIFHRGPDEDGIFTELSGSGSGISMGMRRLSIIDLSTGKQPIYANHDQLIIVFNGEIYNYRPLREKLLKSGVVFKTNSDTEVILRLYELDGEAAFTQLDGMYAFSIYDKTKGKIFIARDFFGEKPLYYANHDNQFIWASELKSIVPHIEKPKISSKGLNLYFRLTYIPAPHTIYSGVSKLEANHYISYDVKDHHLEIKKIHQTTNQEELNDISFHDAKSKVRDLVLKSVDSRSISDVPLGTFLSGGVDSSIVSLCLAQSREEKINTFSIGFKKASFDESDKSRLVAKQIQSNHHEFIIDEDDLKNDIHSILNNFDEPFSDSAALPTYLISKKTREHVKVALTGDGGDEVFGGYNKYYMGELNQKYTRIVPKGIHKALLQITTPLLSTSDDKKGRRYKAKKMMNTFNYENQYYWDIISLGNTERKLKKLLREEKYVPELFSGYKDKSKIQKPKSLTDYRLIDKILSLEGGMLPKVDRTSMLASLECRAPFLNKEIWDFTSKLPETFLLKGWNKKFILKEAFKDQFPDDFLEKSKQGFNTPIGDWLRSGLKKELESYTEIGFLTEQNIFNLETVQKLVVNHLSGKEDSSDAVWTFYCFQKWYCNVYMNL
ncbi:asparagine synthase (glutamine-hydrolyzing) [Flagellimonas sp. S3867]|uniref:asparagine synthase (glutamine-hydrolyzing) n=1 Tax=Flagellimonas sp. S3867 TaxID=2768063 RepID=UPI0016865D57|nr:asparagine synthase (glutamine-hydrolyzing) [Flagellimonas sp. S3867]